MQNNNSYKSILQSFDILVKSGYISSNTMKFVKMFLRIRNKIAHGVRIDITNNFLNILDIGIGLLKIVDSIPYEKNYVYAHKVCIYKDSDCRIPHDKGYAIILNSHSHNYITKSTRIFPTMRQDYEIGMQVTW